MKVSLLAAHLALAMPLCLPAVALAEPPATNATDVSAKEGPELTVTNPSEPWRAFLLPTAARSVSDELHGFTQAVDQGDWQRSFQSLETILDVAAERLVAGPDGFLMPLSSRLRQVVTQLPPEGIQPHKVYFDGRARKLMEEARGKRELANLTTVASAFFMTSSGHQAADRLGDLHFERGEMDKAARLWQAVLAADTNDKLSQAKLQVKVGIALARAERWAEFDAMLGAVRKDNSNEMVSLGGEQVRAVDHLRQLATHRPDAEAAPADPQISAPHPPSDVRLPKSRPPLWRWSFQPQAAADGPGKQRTPQLGIVPAVVCDEHRAYVNLLGWHFALDLETGNVAWRSTDLARQPQSLLNAARSSTDRFNIALQDDVLCFVTRNPRQAAESKIPFRLVSVDPNSGSTRWTSRAIRELRNWTFLGDPLIDGDRVYAMGSTPEPPFQWNVLAMASDNGRLLWSTRIGTYLDGPVRIRFGRSSQPQMVLAHRTLVVETHAGSLAALDADSGELKWGFAYQLPSAKEPQPLPARGPPQLADGLLYVKGMRSSGLYSLDLGQPAVTSSLHVPPGSMILGVDDQRIYLGGEQVMAIDRYDNSVVWTQRIPTGIGWDRPVLTNSSVIAMTPGGLVEIDKSDGSVVSRIAGADRGSFGGRVMVTSQGLWTVSNQAITAYPLE